jgi:hypothetical protein
MSIRWPAVLVVAGLSGVPIPDARAQSVDGRLPGRFEFAIGPMWLGRTSFGTSDASETAADGGRFRLFSTSTELKSASGFEARVGVRMTRALQGEAVAAYSVPVLTTKTSGDVENAAPVSATEPITQLTIQGAIVAHLTAWHVGRGGVPFVTAGAGYLRQLHQSHTLVETGETYHLGGGVKYLLLSRGAARLKGLGVRAEVRAIAGTKGIAIDHRLHISPALAASIFVRF